MAINGSNPSSNKIGEVINQWLTSKKTTNANEQNCAYTVKEIYKEAGMNAEKQGIDPYVPTTQKNFQTNGQWREVQATERQAGDVILSRIEGGEAGHIGLIDKDKNAVAANEGNKALAKSNYAPGSPGTKIYRAKELDTGNNLSTIG